MKTLNEVLSKKLTGLHYGNRVLLPFSCHILKLNIERDLITDFSPCCKGVHISETEDFMEIYFHDYKNLSESIGKYEKIKMIVVEKGKDVFNAKNRIPIALNPVENHVLEIEQLDDNIVFIE
jgi:hypothetical protein